MSVHVSGYRTHTGKSVGPYVRFSGSPNRGAANLARVMSASTRASRYLPTHKGINYSPQQTQHVSLHSEHTDLGGLDLKRAPLHEIARHIEKDWGSQGKGVNYAARPYLDAMHSLEHIHQNYYADSGASVVSYFLSNASSYRGPKAKAIKAELKSRVKSVYG